MFALEAILLYIQLTLGITDPTQDQIDRSSLQMNNDASGTYSYFESSGYTDADGDGAYTYEEPTSSNTVGGWDYNEGN